MNGRAAAAAAVAFGVTLGATPPAGAAPTYWNCSETRPTYQFVVVERNNPCIFQWGKLDLNWTSDRDGNRYRFVFQNDGNLVFYRNGRAVWWQNDTTRSPSEVGNFKIQPDGNVVGHLYYGGSVAWQLGTRAPAGTNWMQFGVAVAGYERPVVRACKTETTGCTTLWRA